MFFWSSPVYASIPGTVIIRMGHAGRLAPGLRVAMSCDIRPDCKPRS